MNHSENDLLLEYVSEKAVREYQVQYVIAEMRELRRIAEMENDAKIVTWVNNVLDHIINMPNSFAITVNHRWRDPQ